MRLFVDGRRSGPAHGGDVSSLLKKLGIRREEAVVKVNGRLVPDTALVGGKDTVEVVRVVFGG